MLSGIGSFLFSNALGGVASKGLSKGFETVVAWGNSQFAEKRSEKLSSIDPEIEKLQLAYCQDRLVADPMLYIFHLALTSLKHDIALLEMTLGQRVWAPGIKMLTLEESGQISTNLQGYEQSAARFAAAPTDLNKRTQLIILYKHIIKALKWFRANQPSPEVNKPLRLIYESAILGLDALKETYYDPKAIKQDPIIKHLEDDKVLIRHFLDRYNGPSGVSSGVISEGSACLLSPLSDESPENFVEASSEIASSSKSASVQSKSHAASAAAPSLPVILKSHYTRAIDAINKQEFPLSEEIFPGTRLTRDEYVCKRLKAKWKEVDFSVIAGAIESIREDLAIFKRSVKRSKGSEEEYTVIEEVDNIEHLIRLIPKQLKDLNERVRGLEQLYQGRHLPFLHVKESMLEADSDTIIAKQRIKDSVLQGVGVSLSKGDGLDKDLEHFQGVGGLQGDGARDNFDD